MSCAVPGRTQGEGAITVPAKPFAGFVNSRPRGQIESALNVRTKTVHLKSATTEANMKGLDAEEFPIIPAIPDKPTTRMSQGVLRRSITEVAFVAATDDSHPVLPGLPPAFQARHGNCALHGPYPRRSRRAAPVPGAPRPAVPARHSGHRGRTRAR